MKTRHILTAAAVVLGMLGGPVLAEDAPQPTPKKHYLIAFSNGDMNNSWRAAFVNSMEQWGKKFKDVGPGVDYVWTNSAGDSAKQLQDAQTLLAQKPDMLILSPNQSVPLDPVIDMATKANVPLMVIDRSLERKPPTGTYVLNITQNYAISGMTMAYYALEHLKQKHGAYKGNIVEIQGELGSSPNTDMWVGIREVLKHYPDVKILSTEEGKWSNDGGRRVMQGFLQRFSDDEMDVIFTYADAEGLGAIQAIKAAGRESLLDGRIASKDGDVAFIQYVLDGKAMMSTECPPYYGAFAIPEAIQYLNGDLDQKGIQFLSLRTWPNPNVPTQLAVSGDQVKEILTKQIAFTNENKLPLIPPETGNYEELHFDASKVTGYDDVMAYSKSGEVPKDLYDLQNTK
ncbi:MAG: substrate-binding domain-containing protein [Rhizobiales bacterium]|nr:substrate-binding domain-containing protein [Hyphomicrobiales bacterium]